MNRQEAFDTAAAHLLKTGRPSMRPLNPTDNRAVCVYAGTGCALAPFIPEGEAEKWDEYGSPVEDMPEDILPDFILRDINFFRALQNAHDEPAMQLNGRPKLSAGYEGWRADWESNMRAVAKKYNLSAAIFDAAAT